MRRPSFHLAMRSDLENEPTFNCLTPHPTARWTIVVSSVSPDRADTMDSQPAVLDVSNAAFVSLKVPA